MAVVVTESIRKMIYNELHITGTPDDSTKERIENEIIDGIVYLKKYANPDMTFEEGTDGADLLKTYVMYAEDDALEMFRQNYKSEILTDQALYDADGYAKSMGYTS